MSKRELTTAQEGRRVAERIESMSFRGALRRSFHGTVAWSVVGDPCTAGRLRSADTSLAILSFRTRIRDAIDPRALRQFRDHKTLLFQGLCLVTRDFGDRS